MWLNYRCITSYHKCWWFEQLFIIAHKSAAAWGLADLGYALLGRPSSTSLSSLGMFLCTNRPTRVQAETCESLKAEVLTATLTLLPTFLWPKDVTQPSSEIRGGNIHTLPLWRNSKVIWQKVGHREGWKNKANDALYQNYNFWEHGKYDCGEKNLIDVKIRMSWGWHQSQHTHFLQTLIQYVLSTSGSITMVERRMCPMREPRKTWFCTAFRPSAPHTLGNAKEINFREMGLAWNSKPCKSSSW